LVESDVEGPVSCCAQKTSAVASKSRASASSGRSRSPAAGVSSRLSYYPDDSSLSDEGDGPVAGFSVPAGGRPAGDMASIFRWPQYAWYAAVNAVGDAVAMSSMLFAGSLSVSTHFSGLGSAELALAMLSSWAPVVVRRHFAARAAFTCKKSTALAAILRSRSPGSCVFQNIMDRVGELPEHIFERGGKVLNFDAAKAAVLASQVNCFSRCFAHRCQRRVPRADVENIQLF
jgi:hypothetical protein